MPSFLEKFSLFPYMDLWRIGGRTEVNNKCAGIVSIFLIIAIGAIAVTKLIEVSNMTTIFSSVQTQIQTIPPMINLTTSYTDPNMDQYMFAFRFSYYNSLDSFQENEYQFTLSYSTQVYDLETKTFSYDNIDYAMQKCTPNHFYKLPNITANFYNWAMDVWWCLPINRTFQIGGTQLADLKNLLVSIQCVNTACQAQSKSLVLHAYTLNNFVNPTNGANPFTSYINQYEMSLQSYTSARTYLYIDKNTLITDNSLLPYTQETTRNGLQTTQNVITNSFINNIGAQASYFLAHSGTNNIHRRYYLKFLDAFAYLGGIFNALLAAFFFMQAFGCFFFQMEFASSLFTKSKYKEITILTHIKQMIYSFFGIFNKKLDWPSSKYIQEVRTTVSNLLDIVYLQRRLQFLEKGMEVLFEKHHLKGLYLAHEITKEAADENHENFEITHKFSQFVKTKPKDTQFKKQKPLVSNIQLNDSSKVKIDNAINSQGEMNKIQMNKKLQIKHLKNKKPHLVQSQRIENYNELNESQRQALSLDQEDLVALMKLCRQAKQKRGDGRSRKIYEKIDAQVRQRLQEMLKSQVPNITDILIV